MGCKNTPRTNKNAPDPDRAENLSLESQDKNRAPSRKNLPDRPVPDLYCIVAPWIWVWKNST